MINRLVLKHGIASLAVLASLLGASANADITWVMQPSQSPVVFSGSLGLAVFNSHDLVGSEVSYSNGAGPEWIQRFDGVVQHTNQFDPTQQAYDLPNGQTVAGIDPNWGTYAGFSNSTQTSASGSFTSLGNDFIHSLNFGNEPVINNFANFNPTTQFATSGNYYPDSNGSPSPGYYGNATPAQVALTFVGASGSNVFATGTPAQQAQFGTTLSAIPGGGQVDVGYGPNGHGDAGTAALTGTAGYASSDGHTVTPTASGSFDAGPIHFTGVLAFSASFQADPLPGQTLDQAANSTADFTPNAFFTLVNQANGGTNGLASISNSLSGATGQISRGPNAAYLITVPYQATMSFGTPYQPNVLAGQADPGRPGETYGPNIGTAVFIDLKFTSTFVAQANIRPGDANFDGIVNSQDLAQVSSNWLVSNPSGLQAGDVNGDGIVNSQDLALISSNWLKTTPPLPGSGNASAVPEPGTWILLGIGGILLAIRRRLV
jgi:hypothetical protein